MTTTTGSKKPTEQSTAQEVISRIYQKHKEQPPPDTFTVEELVNWIPEIEIDDLQVLNQGLADSMHETITEADAWHFAKKIYFRLVECGQALFEWDHEDTAEILKHFKFNFAQTVAPADNPELKLFAQWANCAQFHFPNLIGTSLMLEGTSYNQMMLNVFEIASQSSEPLPLANHFQVAREKAVASQPTATETVVKAIEAINRLWVVAHDHNPELRHPIAPLVRAFIDQPPKIKPENRETAIAPEGFRTATRSPAKQGELFEVGSLPTGEIEYSQGYLPGLEIPDSQIVPALPLDIYEASGGLPLAPGRGAPLSQRIFINALLAYPAGERRGETVELTTTLRDIKQWLYPKGHKETKRVFLKRLRKALVEVHNYRISWERRDWHIIGVEALPNLTTKNDDPLPFTIKLPQGMDTVNGALVDLHPLRLYGANSAPKFRAWIRLAYIWDKAKALNAGHRIYATRPKAKRDDRGRLLDEKGELIPGRAGKASTKWNHPNAIWEGTEPNPASKKVPVLNDEDMVRLFFDDQDVPKGTFRKRLHDAKKHALEMETDGHVVVEQNVKDPKTGVTGWRILEPRNAEVYNR